MQQNVMNAHELVTKIGVTHKVMTVTPAQADVWLNESNTRNRNVREPNVRIIKHHMLNGTFQSLNGQSIVFANTGLLLDGQHRLQALFEANMSFPFLIVEGVDEAAFTTIDLGLKRQTKDVFHIEQIPYANGISAAVAFFLKFKMNIKSLGDAIHYYNITADDVLNTYIQNSELFQTLYVKAFDFNKKMKILTPSQITGLMVFTVLNSKYAEKAVEEFWTPLFTGTNASEQVLLCRQRFIQLLGLPKSKSVPQPHKIAWIIHSYNNHFNGKSVKFLKFVGTKLPEFV